MHKINQERAQMLSDTVQSSGGLNAEMLSVVARKGLGGATVGCLECALPL